MKLYVMYASDTGAITDVAVFNNGSQSLTEAPKGYSHTVLDTRIVISPQTHYMKDGYPVEFGSPRPTAHHRWNGQAWAIPTSMAAILVREERNQRLKDSDWTQLPDVPIDTKSAWAAYRQALRDITTQAEYPDHIDWPEIPA